MPSFGKRDFLKIASGSMLFFAGTAPATAQSASFAASNFDPDTSGNTGATINATVTVSNSGETAGTTQVEWQIGTQSVDSEPVTVEPGTSKQVTLQGELTLGTGTYTQRILLDGAESDAESTFVVNPTAADFVVDSITTSNSEGRVGDEVSATATLRNRGETAGTSRFQYRIRGRVIQEREIQLNAGETRVVTFSGSVPNVAAGETRQGVFVGDSNAGVDRPFTVLADGASFSVTSFSGPSRATAGESVSATATVRNTGGSSGTTTFRYRIDGTRVASREVTLGSGESRSISLSGEVPDLSSGTYQQGVFVRDTSNGLTSSIRIDGPQFGISRLSAPSEAEVGDEITVEARVTNNGSSRRESRIEYRIDGDRLGRETVELGGGRSTTVSFTVTVPDRRPRTYEQGVFIGSSNRGQTTSLRIRARSIFTVSGFEGPRTATVGDEISGTATVRNRGDERVTRTVEYRIGGRRIARRDVRLSSGSRETVSLSGTVPSVAAGSYTQGLYVEREGSTNSIRISARTDPEFSVTNFSGDEEGAAGDTVTAEATVENTGTGSGSITVEYRINGRIVDADTVTIAAGDSEAVDFEGQVPNIAAGEYDHGVFIANTARGRSGRFTVTDASTADDGEADDGETDDGESTDGTDDSAPGFGLGAAAAGTAGAAYLYNKFGATASEQPESAD